ncbi:Hypothetical predicted protein [Paramuricea clavata]|uniref:Uncharacterized protein n=1 Tax=Paramuricea clavata TaxID=317549 RepID=A0A7D9E7M4_PARCT|nr:Hypothetical predicted protein [Paramuricea clavata]
MQAAQIKASERFSRKFARNKIQEEVCVFQVYLPTVFMKLPACRERRSRIFLSILFIFISSETQIRANNAYSFRVEVLSWNENQVADLLREHQLLDCVDCIYQRHINGQKLLYLKEGDVMYFLEIHDQRSRGKFWNIVKQITEKNEKKGGVHSLMSKFQDTSSEWNNAVEEDECSDASDDSFESDYDEPDPDPEVEPKPQAAISLERKETIRRNLLMSLMPQTATPQVDDDSHEDYPEPEDIYDVPEEGFGEPDEDMYDVPSDESGGGL